MAGIRIEFAQFGHFESFDLVRSNTSMAGIADADLPSPIATGLSTMFYVDNNVVPDEGYFYKARVWRNGIALFSEEIEAFAMGGTVFLPFNKSTTQDIGSSGVVWTAINNPTIVDRSIYFNGLTNRSHIVSVNNALNLGTANCSIQFEIKLLPNNTNTYLHIVSGESTSNWNNGIQIYVRHTEHNPLVGLEVDYYGANYSCKSTIGSVPYNAWCKVKFIRIGTSLQVYINDVLNNSITIPATLPINFNLSGTRIGGASWSSSSYFCGYMRKFLIAKL